MASKAEAILNWKSWDCFVVILLAMTTKGNNLPPLLLKDHAGHFVMLWQNKWDKESITGKTLIWIAYKPFFLFFPVSFCIVGIFLSIFFPIPGSFFQPSCLGVSLILAVIFFISYFVALPDSFTNSLAFFPWTISLVWMSWTDHK